MKRIFNTIYILLAVCCLVSCSKDENPNPGSKEVELVDMTFFASDDAESKTVLSGKDILFQESDAISIINSDGNTKFTANKPSKYASEDWPMPKADFVGQASVATPYYALYPYTESAAISDGNITGVVIPAEQAATEGTFDPKANSSICKASASKHLNFLNVGAYFEFKTDADYDKVVIISNTTEPIAGTVTVDPETGIVAAVENGVNKVAMTNVKAGKTYYAVVLPAAMKNGISVQCFNGTESAGTVVTNASITTNRAKIKKLGTIKPTPIPPYETIPGDYSIRWENGKPVKIRFAKANLQYQASTKTWRFAPAQWVVLRNDENSGNETSTGRDSQEKWIDLFGFGCTGVNNGQTYYQPWDSWRGGSTESASTSYYGNTTDKKELSLQNGSDWGYVVSGNRTDYWFTLSAEEWAFMANTAVNSTAVDCREKHTEVKPEHTYATVLVCGVHGMLYFPDCWKESDWPADVAEPTEWDTCGQDGTVVYGVYNADDFAKIEATGIVFFPVSGFREGETWKRGDFSSIHTDGSNEMGFYWSRSHSTTSSKRVLIFASGDGRNPLSGAVVGENVPSGHSDYAAYGHAVRLVMIPKE